GDIALARAAELSSCRSVQLCSTTQCSPSTSRSNSASSLGRTSKTIDGSTDEQGIESEVTNTGCRLQIRATTTVAFALVGKLAVFVAPLVGAVLCEPLLKCGLATCQLERSNALRGGRHGTLTCCTAGPPARLLPDRTAFQAAGAGSRPNSACGSA